MIEPPAISDSRLKLIWVFLLSGMALMAMAEGRPVERGVLLVPNAERAESGFDVRQSAGLFVGVQKFEDPDFTPVPFAELPAG